MTISLSSTSQQLACNAVVGQLDALAGTLRYRAGTTTVANFTLPAPAFGDANISGTAQALGLPYATTAVASGLVDNYQVLDNSGAVAWSGTITQTGVPGGDITIDNPNIAIGQGILVNTWSHTQP
jgi:hypothetical protein